MGISKQGGFVRLRRISAPPSPRGAFSKKCAAETQPLWAGCAPSRLRDSRPPSVGEIVAGNLEEGNFGPKFKIDYDTTKELSQPTLQTTTPPGGSSEVKTTSKGSWQPESERDPERAARILRQHSQEMALRLITLTGFTEDGPKSWQTQLQEIADWFDQDVNQAGQQARQEPRTEVAQSPETASGPSSPVSPDAGDLKDIEMALDCIWVGANAKARERVALYMFSQLEEKDLLRACNQLTNAQDPNTQETTLTAMKARTVKWQGEALPKDSETDESIPF